LDYNVSTVTVTRFDSILKGLTDSASVPPKELFLSAVRENCPPCNSHVREIRRIHRSNGIKGMLKRAFLTGW
jgi:hypothetical protein